MYLENMFGFVWCIINAGPLCTWSTWAHVNGTIYNSERGLKNGTAILKENLLKKRNKVILRQTCFLQHGSEGSVTLTSTLGSVQISGFTSGHFLGLQNTDWLALSQTQSSQLYLKCSSYCNRNKQITAMGCFFNKWLLNEQFKHCCTSRAVPDGSKHPTRKDQNQKLSKKWLWHACWCVWYRYSIKTKCYVPCLYLLAPCIFCSFSSLPLFLDS